MELLSNSDTTFKFIDEYYWIKLKKSQTEYPTEITMYYRWLFLAY